MKLDGDIVWREFCLGLRFGKAVRVQASRGIAPSSAVVTGFHVFAFLGGGGGLINLGFPLGGGCGVLCPIGLSFWLGQLREQGIGLLNSFIGDVIAM